MATHANRRLIALTGVVVLGIAACGGGGGSSNSGSTAEITVMGYPGKLFSSNFKKSFVEPFNKAHLNIDVTYRPGDSSANMLAKLRTEKGNPSVDVSIMDTSTAQVGYQEGLFSKLDPKIVKNLKDIDERGGIQDHKGAAFTFDNLVLLFNAKKQPSTPKSWNVMWKPQYKGQVALSGPPNIQGLGLTAIVDKMQGKNYKDGISPAIEKLKGLASNVSTYDPNPDGYTLVLNGAAALATGWNARAQTYHDQSNGKLGVTVPAPGTVFQINTINLVHGSDNPDAAQKFINYCLNAKAQANFAKSMFYGPTNTKAKKYLDKSVLNRTAVAPAIEQKVIKVDWKYLSGKSNSWTQEWKRKVMSAG